MIRRLTELLSFYVHSDEETEEGLSNGDGDMHVLWKAQKVANVHLLFQVIRTLVSPSNSSVDMVQKAQVLMNRCSK